MLGINRDFLSRGSKREMDSMKSSRHIRWLHISDFHTGKDEYGQRRLFKYILTYIERVA